MKKKSWLQDLISTGKCIYCKNYTKYNIMSNICKKKKRNDYLAL